MGVPSTLEQRAYSVLTIKSFDEDARVITGIASTPETDRVGDIVEPKGAEFRLPMPLLWQHDHGQPIGEVFAAQVTDSGIQIKARIAKIDEPGRLKERIDEAWQAIKFKLVRGLSIGFKPIDMEPIKGTYGYRFVKWMWLELSAVTIPANAAASIQSIKSYDVGRPAATGTGARVSPATSGAPDRRTKHMQNISDSISRLRQERKSKAARMTEIMAPVVEQDATLDAASQQEYDGLVVDVDDIDASIRRFEALERAQIMPAAKAVSATSVDDAGHSRSFAPATVKSNLPPGIEFARYVICLAHARGNPHMALEVAKARYPDNPRIHTFLKAAVAGGTTTDATWAGPLVDAQTLTSEFIDFLRPMTILGKFGTNGIPSLRRVPFNVRITGQTSGGAGYWVGQGVQKPLTKFDYTAVTLNWAKVAAISVISEELARFSSPSAEMLVRDGLAAALQERLDTDFVDPAKAVVANVSPASITNALVALTPSGTDAAAVRADLNQLFSAFIAANITPTTGVFITSQTVALAISLMQNPLGQPEFPNISMTGGTLFGLPVITSQYAATGSPLSHMLILANASDIFLSDDGGVTIDASREASLEMSDDPANEVGTVVSMYQTNQIAIRAERFINWALRRTAAVAYLDGVAYTSGSPA